MRNQAVFSSKDKSRKLKYRLLQFLLGTLRVNCKLHIFSRANFCKINMMMTKFALQQIISFQLSCCLPVILCLFLCCICNRPYPHQINIYSENAC